MSRLFFCLAFILTNSVLAQADELNLNLQGSFDTKGWVTKYAGETELDGLAAVATFDTKESKFTLPQFQGHHVASETLATAGLHFGLPTEEQPTRLFRLTLTAAHNPNVRAVYFLQPKAVSLDGNFTMAYLSDAADERGFSFLVAIDENGDLKVSYTRKTAIQTLSEGRFSMTPVTESL